MMGKGEFELFARCAAGFEEILGEELRMLGVKRVRPQVGGVSFSGRLKDAYRACLWTRVATRIQLVVSRVAATDAETLFEGVMALPWEDHVREGATIAVEAHGTNEELRNTTFTALKVKDALCDRLRGVRGSRPDVDAKNPDVAINVAVHPKKATIYLNLSGSSLHRRGYREDGVQTEAPLKETLAASMLLLAGWPEMAQDGCALVDPMCGSGTLAIEAAMIVRNVAPGLLREHWGFEGWLGHDEGIWGSVVAHAYADMGVAADGIRILAGDLDERSLVIARANAERAQVSDLISFYRDDACNLSRHVRRLPYADRGLLVANPPYGQRLGDEQELPAVRDALCRALDALGPAWTAALITPDAGLETALGRKPRVIIPCHNGPIEVDIRIFDLDDTSRRGVRVVSLEGRERHVTVADETSAQFASRLRKVAKERLRWARAAGVSCLRLYDADLPDFALAVDLYASVGRGRMAVVQEYRRPSAVDVRRARMRMADACALVAAVLDLDRDCVIARPWEDGGRGTSQTMSSPGRVALTVYEDGLTYAIDVCDKPDSGLPLDERELRSYVRLQARGLRFANVGGLASAASVTAACGGAASTVTVEAYPDRARKLQAMLAANGCTGTMHRVTTQDLRDWVERERAARHAFGLIVLAPMPWMEARAGREDDFEVTRDHVSLIVSTASLLTDDGTLLFVCRERGLKVDEGGLRAAGFKVRDLSEQLRPHDFERTRVPLICLEVRRVRRGRSGR